MQTKDPLQGQHGTYTIASSRPFAYGRNSVLYKGEGGHGQVVCLKLFRAMPEPYDVTGDLAEFFRELEIQRSLHHPNILPIVDYGRGSKDDPGPFIVYPLCIGGNIRMLLKGRAYIPLNEAINFLSQIAAAVDYAHGQGFIHGDIKPENVLFVKPNSYAVLSDFGMARLYPVSANVSSRMAIGPGGSSDYLSPEELEHGHQSAASDIYSLGLLAYELLAGTLPFGDNLPLFQQMRAKISGKIKDPVDVNPALPRHVASALKRALSPVPRDRPRTASEFCGLLSGVRTEAIVPQKPGFWNSLGPKERLALITAVVTAVAGVIGTAIKILPALLKP